MTMVDDATWEKGLAVVDRVYGPGSRAMMEPHRASPFVSDIVGYQFAEVWGDDTLSIRDKRLMVLGATAMLGRADLVEIQIGGAITNGEFTDEQLAQIPRFLLTYAGAGNVTAVYQGISAAQAKAKAKQA
jgi:4-carboxymuconolactone decarboxylase